MNIIEKLSNYNSINALLNPNFNWNDRIVLLTDKWFANNTKRLKNLESCDLKESLVLIQKETMLVAVPLTEKASKWWGKGTRWCTAARHGANMFERYNTQAPIVIMVFPNGLKRTDITNPNSSELIHKLQLWVTSENVEQAEFFLMDETDKQVEIDFLQEHWPYFQQTMLWALARNPAAIKYFPENAITDAMVLDVVARKRSLLESIPTSKINMGCVEMVISMEKPTLKGVPQRFLTQSICNRMFDSHQANIEWIPENLQTTEMCYQLLTGNLQFAKFISSRLLTVDLIVGALETYINQVEQKSIATNLYTHCYFNSFYDALDDRFKTTDVNVLFMKIAPSVIGYMSEASITKEIAWQALHSFTYEITKISFSVWDEDMIEFITEHDPIYGSFICKILPQELWNSRIAELLFNSNHELISNIPSHLVQKHWQQQWEKYEEIKRIELEEVRNHMRFLDVPETPYILNAIMGRDKDDKSRPKVEWDQNELKGLGYTQA